MTTPEENVLSIAISEAGITNDQCSQPLDLSGPDTIFGAPATEEPPGIVGDKEEIQPASSDQCEDESFAHCPVLEEQQNVYHKKAKKVKKWKSSHAFSEYTKRRRKKQKISGNVDGLPPNLIPQVDLSTWNCQPGASSLTNTALRIKGEPTCHLTIGKARCQRSQRTPSPKKVNAFQNIKPPGKRGDNGWEECLRPRPPQVEHFQSVMMMEIRKEQDESRQRRMQNVKRKLSFGEKLVTKKIAQFLTAPSPPAEKFSDEENIPKRRSPHVAVYKTWPNEKLLPSVKPSSSLLNQNLRMSSISKESVQIQEESTNVIADDTIIGEIVWAKLGSTRWWPAMAVWGDDCGQIPARNGQVWVFWFGDHKISELPNDKLLHFVSKFRYKYSDLPGKTFKRGVVEAVKEIAVRAQAHDLVADTELIQWAKQGFPTQSTKNNPYAPDPSNPYPESVRTHLARIKDLYQQAMEADAKITQQHTRSRQDQMENEDSMLKKVRAGKVNIQDVCISCDSPSVTVFSQHPLFNGGLCKNCHDEIIDTMFAYGEDGTNAFCVICGNAGILLICDNSECNRCYCTGCIEILVSVAAREKVEAADPWLCYLCNDNKEDCGLIKRKLDWQQNIVKMFQHETDIQVPNMDAYKEKKPIRVLSLFDGIGTCKLVLDQLYFDIGVYYASETDIDARNVVTMHYKDQVNHVGDIEQFCDNKVAKICPIDLVIGGSPCNDLSLVNPARKGLYDPTGTGRLFFDFFRVLKAVQIANKGRHVFWLYENVASMPHEYRNTINRFLQCQPSLIDSKYFSPQNRARYFWGNIPGMYTPVERHLTEEAITLESVLTPYCNRSAQVEKIRTVTTRSNSLKQGKMAIHPVTMNGEEDVLWVTELEQVFGFPKHYTDVGNLALGRRHQLLGKAWSVPVIKHLLTPLKNFFKSSSNNVQVNTAVQTSTTATAISEQCKMNEVHPSTSRIAKSIDSPQKMLPCEVASQISHPSSLHAEKDLDTEEGNYAEVDNYNKPDLLLTNHLEAESIGPGSSIDMDSESIPLSAI